MNKRFESWKEAQLEMQKVGNALLCIIQIYLCNFPILLLQFTALTTFEAHLANFMLLH